MSINSIINKIISLDPSANQYLHTLAHQNVAITCSDFADLTIYCNFTDTYLQFTAVKPEIIDTHICAPLAAYITFLIEKQNAQLQGSGMQIIGNLHTAQSMQQLFCNLNVDWEEELSKLTGDALAHQACFLIRSMQQQHKKNHAALLEMITEYLQEESGLLPTKYEVNEFMQAVDELRLATDRLEARVGAYESD